MSGLPPVDYTLTGSGLPDDDNSVDPAKNPAKYKLTKKRARSYAALPIPPSRPAVTQSRGAKLGYEQRLDFWRLIAVTKEYSDVVQFKSEAIKELQYSIFKPENKYKPSHKNFAAEEARINLCKQNPLQEQDIQDAMALVVDAITQPVIKDPHTLKETKKDLKYIYDKLAAINPNLPDFIAQALNGQYSRGPGNIETALTSFSDLSPNGQWADLMGHYEKEEIIDVLKSALFYDHSEMVVDDKGSATLYRERTNLKTGAPEAVALTKSTVDKTHHTVSFTLEENSVEAVLALADQISTHRQGNNNTIKLTDMGEDPVLFALLVHVLIRQHNMQVHLSDDLIREVTSELAKAGNPEVDQLWQQDVQNRLVFSKLTPRLLNADIPRTKRIKQIQHENPVRLDLFAKTQPYTPNPGVGVSGRLGRKPGVI